MVSIRKFAVTALSGAALAGAVAVAPAEAGWRGNRGAPVVAGVIGGLALGALAAGAGHAYYAEPRYYALPRPRVRYRPQCHLERQPAYDPWGRFTGYRRVQVCY